MRLTTRTDAIFRKTRQLTLFQLLSFAAPVVLGALLGLVLSMGSWFYALAFSLLPPLVLLFTARPFIGVILWLLLMPLSSALPNPELMYWTIHRILVPFTLLLALIPYMVHFFDLPRIKFGVPEAAITLLICYIPVSILLGSGDMRLLIKFADRMLIPFVMYLAVRLSRLDKQNLTHLQWTAVAVGAIQMAIGLLSWTVPHLLPGAWHHLVGARTAGSLLDPAVYTSVLAFCATLLLYAAMQRENDIYRLIFLLVSGSCFVGIFISLERGSWVAGSLVILGLLIMYRKRMLRFLLVAGVAMALFGGGFLARYITLAGQRVGEQRPIDDRIVVTDAMLQMIEAKPIFGWGYDTLNQSIRNFYRQVGSASIILGFTTSHNSYLTIFTELGLIGFLCYMLPAGWLFISSLRAWRGPPGIDSERGMLLATFWLAALHNFIVSNLMDMRYFPVGLTLGWMTLGLIANLLNQHAESQVAHAPFRPLWPQRSIRSVYEPLPVSKGGEQ